MAALLGAAPECPVFVPVAPIRSKSHSSDSCAKEGMICLHSHLGQTYPEQLDLKSGYT